MEKYEIIFRNGVQIIVENPDIDEESRVIKVVSKNKSEEDERPVFDYYPFESIQKIIFLSNSR